MKVPKIFVPKKNLEEKTKELLISKPKHNAEVFPDGRAEDILLEFNELYYNKNVVRGGSKEDLKKVAELAYALAMIAKNMGEKDLKEHYGYKSMEIYKVLNVRTIDDACPYHRRIKDIEIPDLMHEGVVMEMLSLERKV